MSGGPGQRWHFDEMLHFLYRPMIEIVLGPNIKESNTGNFNFIILLMPTYTNYPVCRSPSLGNCFRQERKKVYIALRLLEKIKLFSIDHSHASIVNKNRLPY